MKDYLLSITPDSLTGMIFALEGIKGAVVLLNGPTGCKFYHSATSDYQSLRQYEFDPLNYPEEWYFGQPRVPCTYLDRRDYVYGSHGKLEEAIAFLEREVPFELLCIINSPGAALIGDDLKGICQRCLSGKPFVTIESPGFSRDICEGYEQATLQMLTQLAEQGFFSPQKAPVAAGLLGRPEEAKKRVNLLGLSIFHRNWEGDIAELKRLLALCGIEVNCVLCCDSTLAEVQDLGKAGLNVVLHPEYGLATAQYLKETWGMDYLTGDGLPIGFSATEELIYAICRQLDADDSAFLQECERSRALAYAYVARLNSLTGLPKGVTYSVEGTYSELCSYVRFLSRYFGMVLECAAVLNPQQDYAREALTALLKTLLAGHCLDRDLLEQPGELVLASGNTIAKLKLAGHTFCGIETALPTMGYVNVLPKTHLGLTGALMLVEQVINGVI